MGNATCHREHARDLDPLNFAMSAPLARVARRRLRRKENQTLNGVKQGASSAAAIETSVMSEPLRTVGAVGEIGLADREGVVA